MDVAMSMAFGCRLTIRFGGGAPYHRPLQPVAMRLAQHQHISVVEEEDVGIYLPSAPAWTFSIEPMRSTQFNIFSQYRFSDGTPTS